VPKVHTIAVSDQMFQVLEKLAKHEGDSIEYVAHTRLLRALTLDREEWIAEHPKPPAEITTLDVPVDVCSEEHLRRICGDEWVLCWYLGGCWALPG
jgi:hypothetical protein